MKYLYQQLLAFWSLILLTVVLIGISFTSINKRILVNQNYNQIREYIESVNDSLKSDLSNPYANPYGNLTREEILPYYLANAEQMLAQQGIKFVLIDSKKNVVYPSTRTEIKESLLNDSEWKN
ncbi:hypothetical protein ACWPXT_12670 [Enterococcus faecium]